MKRVALVTGASRNIGQAVSVALAGEGTVVGCYARDADALEETANLIRRTGGEPVVQQGDVSDDERLTGFAERLGEDNGGIDVVVNNAGVMREVSVGDMDADQFRAVLNVNLVSYYALARAAYPFLKLRKGVVINIGSMFAALGVANAASYCASKSGIEGLTRALAAEWAPDGIRVVCVAPGYVESEISRDALNDPQLAKRILSRIPLRRVAKPAEIGEFVAFLASSGAEFITGESYVIDGGQRMAV